MKRFFAKTLADRSIALWCISLFFGAATRLASAASLQEARVSQVIQDVRLLEANGAPRPAVVNDKVTLQRAVRTGKESRAELTFGDLTITRLGANTIFSLKTGAREVDLTSGTILLQVPSGRAPVKANTTSVTVAVMGGTAFLATGPPTKFMVLEGIGTLYPIGHPEKAVTVHGGEMVMMTPDKKVTQPEKFDVKLVLKTSPLIVDFPPLANLPLILAVMNQQLAEQRLAGAAAQPLAKNLVDVINVTDQNANSNPIVLVSTSTVSPAPPPPTPTVPPPTPTPPPPTPTPPPPSPTPSKFGTPSTIISPNPYLITSGTIITTDPSITTNGTTDFGKIYRGQADDGLFTLWAFGSTSAFDNALGIDNVFFADLNHLPIATFKFQSLSLTGNPTIDLSNGGETKLALIGVDGITSGPPGGVLTFTGLDLLALATVNGSINLTSDVSFQGLNELAMYARGAGSDLILDSPISNIGILELAAEGSIQLTNPGTMSVGGFTATAGDNLTLQIGESLLLNGKVSLNTLVLSGTTVANGANLTLNITGDYTNSLATGSSVLGVTNESAHIGTGGNIAVNISGDLTTGSGNDFSLVVHNTNGQIDNGGNITVMTNGSISTGGEFSLLVENYNEMTNPAGHIGTGGNLSLITGGNLTADFASIAINNRGGGRIDSGASLTIDIGGALTTLENGPDFLENPVSLSIELATRYDDQFGNTDGSFIGGDATVNFHADSAAIGGNLGVFLNNRGSTIGGNALLNFNTAHDINVSGVDTLTADAADIGLLNGSGSNVESPFGGTIHGDATLQVGATNLNVTAGSLAVFIDNGNGGLIDSNAMLSVNLAGNLTTQGSADFSILNDQNPFSSGLPGGSIGLAATLTISAADISIGTDFTAQILNYRSQNAPGPGAGSIGTDATLNISANSLTAGGIVDVAIFNRDAGSGSGTGGGIGGHAAINFNLTNSLQVASDADFQILNDSVVAGSPGGFIGDDATINLNIVNASVAGLFDAEIDNFSGGTIGGNAAINLNAASITADSLLVQVDNTGGSIGASTEGGAAINMNVSGSATVTNDATVQILGSDRATSAAINFNGGTYDAGGTFLAFIDGDGTITFNNASAHADVLKVGALGTNGVLNIGGGMLSADTTLELYASGSNGHLNFVSNVTLGGNSVKILAADSVTIFDNVVVTIGGPNAAEVYTNNANYTGFGGNGTTTGTFAGAGADNPLPLDQAPPFGPAHRAVRSSGGTGGTFDVGNTSELLALLDGAAVGPDGRITISDSRRSGNWRDLSRMSGNALLRAEHRMMATVRRMDSVPRGRLPQ